MDYNNINFTLLSRYFANEATPEERLSIEKWIAESDGNKLLVQNAYNLLYTSDTLCLMNEIDADAVLKKIKIKIKKTNQPDNLFVWSQKVINVLFFPLLISVCMYFIPAKEQVRYMEAYASSGLISTIELSDGSKVWLNSGSYIKYPVEFKGKKREVFVTGEAYFSVMKDDDKRFVVRTLDDISVEVVGTEFNIDAYETNDKITTTLIEGKICLYHTDSNKTIKKYSMTPNQQIIFKRGTHEFMRSPTYIYKDIAWKNGRILFRNTTFDEALWILSKRFNVEFTVKNESLHNNSFTGSFTDQNLTRILEHFKISSGINYSQQQIVNEEGETLKTRIELY